MKAVTILAVALLISTVMGQAQTPSPQAPRKRAVAGTIRMNGAQWNNVLNNAQKKQEVEDKCADGVAAEANVPKADVECTAKAGSLILEYVIYSRATGAAATQQQNDLKAKMNTVAVSNFQALATVYTSVNTGSTLTLNVESSSITATGPVTTAAPTPAPTPEPTPAPTTTSACDAMLATLVKSEVVEVCNTASATSTLCGNDDNDSIYVNEPERRPSTAVGASCLQVANFLSDRNFEVCLTTEQQADVEAIRARCAVFNGAERVAAAAAVAVAVAAALF